MFIKRFIALLLTCTAGSIGVRQDQVHLYIKDMYKVGYDVMEKKEPKFEMIYDVKSGKDVYGAGTRDTQLLGADELDQETAEGTDIDFVSPIEGWTTYGKYITYKKGVKFTKQAVDDDVKLGNMVKSYAETWADRYIVACETLASTPFNRGGDLLGNAVFDGSHPGNTDSSGNLLYDSKPLFNLTGNKRTTKGGGTYYNSVAGATVTPSNFETLYNLMTATNNRDEQDIIRANPADTVITRPGADAFAAQKILNTTRGLPGGQLNDANIYYGLIDTHIAWDYLSSAEAAWFLGRRKDPNFQFHKREEPTYDFFIDPKNRTANASVFARIGVYFKAGAWRAWVRGGGTSA